MGLQDRYSPLEAGDSSLVLHTTQNKVRYICDKENKCFLSWTVIKPLSISEPELPSWFVSMGESYKTASPGQTSHGRVSEFVPQTPSPAPHVAEYHREPGNQAAAKTLVSALTSFPKSNLDESSLLGEHFQVGRKGPFRTPRKTKLSQIED